LNDKTVSVYLSTNDLLNTEFHGVLHGVATEVLIIYALTNVLIIVSCPCMLFRVKPSS